MTMLIQAASPSEANAKDSAAANSSVIRIALCASLSLCTDKKEMTLALLLGQCMVTAMNDREL